MASEVFSARETRVTPLNAISQRSGIRDGLLRTMASQMKMARTNADKERIYKAANDEAKRLTGKGISRKEAADALINLKYRKIYASGLRFLLPCHDAA